MEIKEIGYIRTYFKSKFGVPRQSGISKSSLATLVFNKEFATKDAVRGLENYSHVWVIWGFSECYGTKFSPTVRPPVLGGNTRVGVFASRSPFRPNNLALSVLKLEGIELNERDGVVLHLSGADMMDSSPVYDIKPYLPYADSVVGATGGFYSEGKDRLLEVIPCKKMKELLSNEEYNCLIEVLQNDPRPSYIDSQERIFGFPFSSFEVKFKVEGRVLYVVDIVKVT